MKKMERNEEREFDLKGKKQGLNNKPINKYLNLSNIPPNVSDEGKKFISSDIFPASSKLTHFKKNPFFRLRKNSCIKDNKVLVLEDKSSFEVSDFDNFFAKSREFEYNFPKGLNFDFNLDPARSIRQSCGYKETG